MISCLKKKNRLRCPLPSLPQECWVLSVGLGEALGPTGAGRKGAVSARRPGVGGGAPRGRGAWRWEKPPSGRFLRCPHHHRDGPQPHAPWKLWWGGGVGPPLPPATGASGPGPVCCAACGVCDNHQLTPRATHFDLFHLNF